MEKTERVVFKDKNGKGGWGQRRSERREIAEMEGKGGWRIEWEQRTRTAVNVGGTEGEGREGGRGKEKGQ